MRPHLIYSITKEIEAEKISGLPLLAIGDSWFDVGSLPPWDTSNILYQLDLKKEYTIVGFARSGQELKNMVNELQNRALFRELLLKNGIPYRGILVSGGGNDLIALAAADQKLDRSHRILLNTSEVPAPQRQLPEAYIYPQGLEVFKFRMLGHYQKLIETRNKNYAGIPILAHSYAYATPRMAGIPIVAPNGWLAVSLKKHKIPPELWGSIKKLLINEMFSVIEELAKIPGNRVVAVDTKNLLTPAEPGSKGESNDWENEIHPNLTGYKKLAAYWSKLIDSEIA